MANMTAEILLANLPILARAYPDRTTDYWLGVLVSAPDMLEAEIRRAKGDRADIDIDALATSMGETISDKRREFLQQAAGMGATIPVLQELIRARRIRRDGDMVLPAGKYEGLSRGKGWARQGTRSSATWGERVDGGYSVGLGRWTVGSSDGFSRKSEDEWVVEEIEIAPGVVWTVAS